jgi:serine/threonine protein kinase
VRPGFYAGADDGDPAKYRLETKVYEGGEGTVWRAVSNVDGADERWALKILRSEHVEQQPGETPAAAMRRWKGIWKATIDRTAVLGTVPGLIPATDAFVGAAPHPHPQPPPGAGRALYLVTRWVDGPDLATWHARYDGKPAGIVDVVTQLCDVVDRLADARWVHRDLCPRNVMLDAAGRSA